MTAEFRGIGDPMSEHNKPKKGKSGKRRKRSKGQKKEKQVREPQKNPVICSMCSKPIEIISTAVSGLESGEIAHLECMAKHYEKVEEALHETLQTAKTSAEQKLSSASQEAKNIVDKAEMEADSIVKSANSQRQEIRQSILRLIDRRNEMINTLKSYLDTTQNSLDTFSRDDSSLFTVPKREISEQVDESDMADSGKPKKSGKDSSSDQDSILYGNKNIDDIIDDID